jgi:c-di-GMP-binding flagellar brake protein YcgR
MWDGFDQRRFPRLQLNCEIIIHPEAEKAPIATKTENVGAGGVCVVQGESLERFSRCRIRLELDKNLPVIECTGKVVWIIPRREPLSREKQFDTGIEFVDIQPGDRERIRTFIQELLPKGFQEIA